MSHCRDIFLLLGKILSKKKQRCRQYNREKSLRTGCILFKFLQRRAQNKILARQCVQCTKHTWLYSMLAKENRWAVSWYIIYFWIMQRLSHESWHLKILIMMSGARTLTQVWFIEHLSWTNPCKKIHLFEFHCLQF